MARFPLGEWRAVTRAVFVLLRFEFVARGAKRLGELEKERARPGALLSGVAAQALGFLVLDGEALAKALARIGGLGAVVIDGRQALGEALRGADLGVGQGGGALVSGLHTRRCNTLTSTCKVPPYEFKVVICLAQEGS